MLKRKITSCLSIAVLALSLCSFNPETSNRINSQSEKREIPIECKYSQCQATAKSTGKQCKHCVSNQGDLYCWQHK